MKVNENFSKRGDCASHGGLAALSLMTGDLKLNYKQP